MVALMQAPSPLHAIAQAKSAGQLKVSPLQAPLALQSMRQVVPAQPPVQAAGQAPGLGGVTGCPQEMH
jgi:hypothetical protein